MRSCSHYTGIGVEASRNVLSHLWKRYRKLSWNGKALIWCIIVAHILIIGAIISLGPKKLFQTLYDMAQRIRHMRFGWLLLSSVAVLTSFPPLVGYSIIITLCGFAYGQIGGFAIAAPSAVIGSALTFIILRLLFMDRIKSRTQKNPRWLAMEQVIEAKGLPLIILIRLCPIPWVYSNALFASIEAVRLWQFVLATICFLPKLAIIIFVGSQVANLSDGKTRRSMTLTAKLLDVLSIVLSCGVAVGTGWFVWAKTQEKIRRLQEEGLLEEIDGEAAAVLDEAARPLLSALSSSDSLASNENGGPLENLLSGLTGTPKESDDRV